MKISYKLSRLVRRRYLSSMETFGIGFAYDMAVSIINDKTGKQWAQLFSKEKR